MATKTPAAKTPAAKTAVRRTLVDLPVSATTPMNDADKAAVAVASSEDRLMVQVPKAYKLTLDNGSPVDIHAGVQMMPREMAEHWYSKAQGVVEFDPENT